MENAINTTVPQAVITITRPMAYAEAKLTRRSLGAVSLHPAYDAYIIDGTRLEVWIKNGYTQSIDDISILVYYGGNKRG
jgi:hypothetical protein